MSFLQLETLTNVSAAEKDAIQTLAVAVFKANSPADPAKLPEPYVKCLEVGTPYRACVISGRYGMTLSAWFVFCFPVSHCLPFIGSSFFLIRAIQDSPYHACKVCRHVVLENELMKTLQSPGGKLKNCPLCHSVFVIPNNLVGAGAM